ncbi:tetratricopeptide repeat-containing sensor histidine kinase [Polaribacter sp.]|uniref:tetratricopeptide repeat-containing sensor histidine kinase n=1 Tax=Polaribacter sp. TaxID=1920175 RepID=UPI003EF68CFF
MNSQNKRLDSLLHESKNAKDTVLITYLNEISWEYKNSNLDTALYFGKKALRISKAIKNKKSIATSYNSIGSVFQAKSNKDSALYYHTKSLELKKIIHDSIGIADSYTNLGIIFDESGDYLEALKNYFIALKIYEEKSTKFDQVPAVLVNIGIVYKKQKKYAKVLEYYNKALKIYEENDFKIGIVITTGNIGAVLLKLGENKEAITYSKNARKIYSDLGYKRYVPYMNANIAEAEYNLKEYATSIKRYLQVIKEFNVDRNLYELASAKIGISKPYISTKQYYKAKTQLHEALNICTTNKYKEFEVDALKYLSEVHFKSSNYKVAYEYEQEYNLKKDSLFEKTKIKDINELLVKYETSKKEKEIAIQKEQLLQHKLAIKNRNLYTLLLTSALLILGIIFFAIYKKNQFKRKQLQKEIYLKDALSTIKTQNRLQEQRLKISRDLHDNIGSQLTFIISSINNLKFITKDSSATLKNKLSSISSFTSETIHHLRDTIWAMNKSEISMEDLHARILSFVEKAKIATENIAFEIHQNVDEKITFSSIEGMNVFRVIQEALNNAIKYADASKVTITMSKDHENLHILIADNGNGFDMNSIELGNGLSNMEKRMAEINGTVKISSQLKKGTKIALQTPVKNTSNDV